MSQEKGRVTIPTDIDVIQETLDLSKRWGADAVRDCDGTDFPVELKDCLLYTSSLPICAGLAVKSGLPLEEGLRAITCNPARICRVFDRVGSLEPGKDADIAIFTGNPMETFTRTMCTIINGKIVYRDTGF